MSHGKRYIDIAHGDPDAFLWVYDSRDRVVHAIKVGASNTHESVWGYEVIKVWRGRYDPKTGEVSIVIPEGWNPYHGVPSWVQEAIEHRFGGTLHFYEFNPIREAGE